MCRDSPMPDEAPVTATIRPDKSIAIR
jgi:hypothetical protein